MAINREISVIVLLLLGTSQFVKAQAEWTDVIHDVLIAYDLEEHPLQIRTYPAEMQLVTLYLHTAGGDDIGSIHLRSYDNTYWISSCTSSSSSFPAPLPEEQDKIWTITKTATTLTVVCNGVQVLEYRYSESDRDSCASAYSQDVEQIMFLSAWGDSSNEYREKPSDSRDSECIEDDDTYGSKYRGTQNITITGNICQKWSSQTPNPHSGTPENYPDTGLGDHNYCRNPDGGGSPWCFNSASTSPRWEYCDIPACSEDIPLDDEVAVKFGGLEVKMKLSPKKGRAKVVDILEEIGYILG